MYRGFLTKSRTHQHQASAKDESTASIPRTGPLSEPPYIVSPLEVVRTNPCFQPQAQGEEQQQQACSTVASAQATEEVSGPAAYSDGDGLSKPEIVMEVASTNDEESSIAAERGIDICVEDGASFTGEDPPSSCKSVNSPEPLAAPLDEKDECSDSIHNNKDVKSAGSGGGSHSVRLNHGDDDFERHLLPSQETSLSYFTEYGTASETDWAAGGSVSTTPLGQVRQVGSPSVGMPEHWHHHRLHSLRCAII